MTSRWTKRSRSFAGQGRARIEAGERRKHSPPRRSQGTLARVTKLRWTTQAVEDVEAIRKFVAHDSDAYADLVVARLLEAVERLELFPRSGRIVPELADPQLREVIEPPYRIVYRVLDESVEILTVFRASRLFRSAFED